MADKAFSSLTRTKLGFVLAASTLVLAIACSAPAAAPTTAPAAPTKAPAAATTAPAAPAATTAATAPAATKPAATAPAAAGGNAPLAAAPSPANPGAKGSHTIVLSNSYLGNAWRKTMAAQFEEAAKAAVASGDIKSYTVQNTAQNAATEQIAQIQSLILQKPSAIVLNPASQTALDPVIAQATQAGIVVVVFDSLVNAPSAVTMAHDFVDVGYRGGDYIAKKLNGQGNVVEVRGVTGSQPDAAIHQGYMKVIQENPGLKIVGSVQGEASQTTTAQALQGLLPSLPKVDAVFNQGGGDAQGVIQAFQNANKPIPLIVLDGGGNALQWYQQQNKATGYETISLNTMPSQSTIGLWAAIDILQGQKVPMHLNNIPPLQITAQNLDAFVKATPADGIASPVYSHQDARALFDAALGGKELPLPPNPR